jgi:hypothetical protein
MYRVSRMASVFFSKSAGLATPSLPLLILLISHREGGSHALHQVACGRLHLCLLPNFYEQASIMYLPWMYGLVAGSASWLFGASAALAGDAKVPY